MRVLFLDVDGVLNCQSDWSKPENKNKGTYVIDQEKVGRLLALVKEFNLKIVLSSSWRNHQDHVDYLWEQGVLSELWLHEDWRTVEISCLGKSSPRGNEVQEWLDRHPEVTEYVIVDDDAQFLKHQNKRMVRTSFHDAKGGLQDKHIKRLRAILEGEKV